MITLPPWSRDEDRILTSTPHMEDIVKHLPRRTKKSIETRMKLLSVAECTELANEMGFRWTCSHTKDVVAACVDIEPGHGRRSMDVIEPLVLSLIRG